MGLLRNAFPEMSITPKLHFLEKHVCQFLRKWHMGLGFYGEQGIEGLHKEINIRSAAFSQVLNPLQNLKQLVTSHHIATSPSLAHKAPQPKSRLRISKKTTEE